jgi:AraC-like DNA-binding protein
MDVLDDVLARSRARGAAFSYSVARGQVGIEFPRASGLAIHAVVDGEAFLWKGDAGGPDADAADAVDAERLIAGDLALVRGSLQHRIAPSVGARCIPLAEMRARPQQGPSRRLTLGSRDEPSTASFFCGAYLFEGELAAPLLEALPDVMHLRPASGGPLRATVDLLARELLGDEPGQQTLLDRLLDAALIHILRQHLASAGEGAPSWFRALADPRIGATLRAVHEDPARPWTVADLAAEVSLSRAAFARRFTALVGVAPLAYLTEWRMALACDRLRATDDGLAAVARSVGYGSEFSFAAAFKRRHGISPGRWRQRNAAAPAISA